MTIEDLFNLKINQQNYFEVKQSVLIAVCSFCLNNITSTSDLILCGTECCLYKLCSRRKCHHIVDNVNYYLIYFIANKYTDKDNTERAFEENYNDEGVTVFGNTTVDDDVQSVSNTLISFGGNTFFNGLPDFNAVEDFVAPPLKGLECLPIPPSIECNTNENVSVGSKLS